MIYQVEEWKVAGYLAFEFLNNEEIEDFLIEISDSYGLDIHIKNEQDYHFHLQSQQSNTVSYNSALSQYEHMSFDVIEDNQNDIKYSLDLHIIQTEDGSTETDLFKKYFPFLVHNKLLYLSSICDKFEKQFDANELQIKTYLDFFVNSFKHGKRKITKDLTMLKLIGLLLTPYMMENPFTKTTNEKVELVKSAINLFDLTIIENFDEDLINMDPNFVYLEEIIDDKIKNLGSTYNLKPILLFVDEDSKETIYPLVRLCKNAGTPIKFVLYDNEMDDECIKQWNIFRNLVNLKQRNNDLYQKFINIFKISLQGREAVSIKKIFGIIGTDLDEFITTNEVMDMLNSDLLMGNEIEKLPVPYINRKLKMNSYKMYKDTDVPLENKLNVILGKPGNGKTTLLNFIATNLYNLDYWVVSICLKEHSTFFKSQPKASEMVSYFFDFNRQRKIDEILEGIYRKIKKIVFFFDGLNELDDDCVELVTKTLKTLSSKDNFIIWISSRIEMTGILKNKFSSSDFFHTTDDDYFKELYFKMDSKTYSKQQLNAFLSTEIFAYSLRNGILGTPLILYMIKDMIIINDNENLRKIVDNFFKILTSPTKLYDYYVEKKYEKNFERLKNINELLLKDLSGPFKEYFFEQYQIGSLKTCLSDKLFNSLKIKNDLNFMKRLRNDGDPLNLIRKINADDTFVFINYTFAEYFAACWLYENSEKILNLGKILFVRKNESLKFFYDDRRIITERYRRRLHYQDTKLNMLTKEKCDVYTTRLSYRNWTEGYYRGQKNVQHADAHMAYTPLTLNFVRQSRCFGGYSSKEPTFSTSEESALDAESMNLPLHTPTSATVVQKRSSDDSVVDEDEDTNSTIKKMGIWQTLLEAKKSAYLWLLLLLLLGAFVIFIVLYYDLLLLYNVYITIAIASIVIIVLVRVVKHNYNIKNFLPTAVGQRKVTVLK